MSRLGWASNFIWQDGPCNSVMKAAHLRLLDEVHKYRHSSLIILSHRWATEKMVIHFTIWDVLKMINGNDSLGYFCCRPFKWTSAQIFLCDILVSYNITILEHGHFEWAFCHKLPFLNRCRSFCKISTTETCLQPLISLVQVYRLTCEQAIGSCQGHECTSNQLLSI